MRSNCLFFTFRKFIKDGGFIIIRKSQYGNWSHVMWTGDFKTFEHFVPLNPPLKFPLIQKFYFEGRVKRESLTKEFLDGKRERKRN